MASPVPRSVSLPLPGGRDGATVRVHPLLCGRIQGMPAFLERPGGPKPIAQLRGLGVLTRRSRWSWLPLPAFAIEHPGAGLVLVDSGLDGSVAEDPGPNLGRLAKALFTIDMRPEWAMPAQLQARGLDVADVALVLMTHLHYDHASGLGQLPAGTPVLASIDEWHPATTGGLLQGYVGSHMTADVDWQLVDVHGGERHGALARTLDVFGDGSVRLVATPGHTLGHMSLLLRTDAGERLLTGDAAYARRTLEEGLMPVFCEDDAAYRDSLGQLQRYLADNPATDVACGHDVADWPPRALAEP